MHRAAAVTTGAGFGDCAVDPGELTGVDAVLAISRHHGCMGMCWPRLRAMVAVDTEYGAHPSPAVRSISEDTDFAERLRAVARITQDASGHH